MPTLYEVSYLRFSCYLAGDISPSQRQCSLLSILNYLSSLTQIPAIVYFVNRVGFRNQDLSLFIDTERMVNADGEEVEKGTREGKSFLV